MKDQLLDNHRQTVAAVDLKSEVPGDIKTSVTGTTQTVVAPGDISGTVTGTTQTVVAPGDISGTVTGTTAATNFDDDNNEWELGIGELIIDLDADIEKNNRNIVYGDTDGTRTSALTSARCPPSGGMSNSRTSRMNISSVKAGISSVSTIAGKSLNTVKNTGVGHQASVDKGLKMKIKRKNVGGKPSEAKHEIVQSDTKSHSAVDNNMKEDVTSPGALPDAKSKHNAGKVKSGIHREKKERNNKAHEMNLSSSVIQATDTSVNLPPASAPSVNQGVATSVLTLTNTSSRASSISGVSSVSSVTGAPCFACPTVKLENARNPMVSLKNAQNLSEGDRPKTAPVPKKIKIEAIEKMEEVLLSPAVKDNSTCTSVSTWTDPECLGPCEPGTSVLLEGIVWQETEEGVLVVNVTWRDKTYVGTLLDCTKYDWAPPRLCDSPTDEVDSKAPKVRAKRGRGSSNCANDLQSSETRTAIQSKLRKGKGRRGTVSSTSSSSEFTVPLSPTKSDNGTSGHGKRKGRSADVELGSSDQKCGKRSRSQTQASPTPVSSLPSDFVQPLSPVLLECPEPNCNKKYKHINGLRFHQSHAHANLEVTKAEDSNFEEFKEMVNSSDNDESFQDSQSVPTSPTSSNRNSPVFRQSQTIDTPVSNITPEEEHSVTSVGLMFIPVSNSSTEVSPTVTVMNGELNRSVDQSRIASSLIPLSTNSAICASVTNGQFSVVNPVVSSANSVTVTTNVSIPTSHDLLFSLPTVANTAVVSSVLASIPSTVHIKEHDPYPCHIVTANSLSSSTPYLPDKRHTEEIVEESSTFSSSVRTSTATAAIGHILTVDPNVSSTLHFQNQKNSSALPSPLKPVQPKLTGFDEANSINSSLENFKREKIKHRKKNKEKEETASLHVTFSEGLAPHHGIMNSTLSVGVKTEPVQGEKESGLTSMSCNSSSPGLSSRLPAPAGVTSDAVEEINENLQSPAYSDISDANDSNLPDDHLQEEKAKDDKLLLQQRNGPNQSSEQGLNPIYPYYSPPQYLSPSVPSQCSEITPVSAVDKTSAKEDKLDVTAWIENAKRVGPEDVVNKDIRNHKISRESSTHSSSHPVTSNVPSVASVQDSSVQQQFSYPYNMIPGYHYRVDSAYHLHLLSTDPRYKQQYEIYIREQEKLKKKPKTSHHNEKNDGKETRFPNENPVTVSSFRATDLTLTKTVSSSIETSTNEARRDARISSFHEIVRSLTPPSLGSKEKRNESHKVMKESIELKGQVDSVKTNQYDKASGFEQHQEEVKRLYMMHLAEQHNKNGEQQQQSRIPSHQVETTKCSRSGSTSSGKQISFEDSNKLDSATSTSKGDINKPSSSIASTSSPKGSPKDLSKHFSREHKSNSSGSHNVKKEDNSYTSSKHQNGDDRTKIEKRQSSEGQKPTMETTGPPPPPTNSYAYLHPSYLQAPPHFGHMTFDPKHPMYRGGLNPVLVSPNPHYVGPAFIHSQLRYPVAGTSCEILPHSQSPNDHLGLKLHHTPPPKALDYLHQVSQQYTNHKIHELQGPTSSSSGTSASQSKPADSLSTAIKQEPTRSSDRSRSPPLQRHLHTHHHTHVGVGYPLYDPYGAIIASHQGAAGSVVPI